MFHYLYMKTQELGYYFLVFGNNSVIMSHGSFLHVKKSSLVLINLLAYASCYFIQKSKSTIHLKNSNN